MLCYLRLAATGFVIRAFDIFRASLQRRREGLARQLSRGVRRLWRLTPPGRKARDKELITDLFTETLGRAPTPEELSSRAQRSNSRVRDLDRIRESLCSGPEYVDIVQPVTAEIKSTFSSFCFRQPTSREIKHHLSQFRGGLGSDERALQMISEHKIRNYLEIRPLHLEMDIVNQCNIRCIMCHFTLESISNRKREDISIADFTKVAAEIFPLCGLVSLSFNAEPLLHRKFGELLSIASKYRIPWLYFTTNGLLLDDNKINQIFEHNVKQISISIDAATKQTYERIRMGSQFEKLISNIKGLGRTKERLGSVFPFIHLNFVMMRSNIMELPAFVRLAHELRARSVSATHMTPLEGVDTRSESLYLDKEICNRKIREARIIARALRIILVTPSLFRNSTQTDLISKNNGQFHALPVGKDVNTVSGCMFPWHWVGIQPDGAVRPCGWWYDGEPAMGNIRSQSFEEIWNSESYNKLRLEHLTGKLRGTCQKCPAAGLGSVNNRDSFRVRKHHLCND
jgi:radical SAM protein with 4Fe4S-binding SPASM domain